MSILPPDGVLHADVFVFFDLEPELELFKVPCCKGNVRIGIERTPSRLLSYDNDLAWGPC